MGRRGKYVLFAFDGGLRVALHLSQAGRVDLESPPKATRPRGSVVRLVFRAPPGVVTGVLVREHGTQRRAGWWVLAPGDDGPLAALGPDPYDAGFAEALSAERSGRRLNTWLRDQRVVAGIGRGYADDIANRAGLSPFAPVGSMAAEGRARLLEADEVRARRGARPRAGADRRAVRGRGSVVVSRCTAGPGSPARAARSRSCSSPTSRTRSPTARTARPRGGSWPTAGSRRLLR